MLPTFVIGAGRPRGQDGAVLRRVDRHDHANGRLRLPLRRLAAGGGCLRLRLLSQNLPQRQQECLESLIGAIAVLMVTYMVVWMKRHSRDLKGQLEGAATSALAVGSGFALVAMAFLAVMREGFETVVFLLAAFNESSSGSLAGLGALLGIVAAVALGYGIYRGGVRLNLSRFFRATGLVLVLVAGGLVVNALRTAHEAGWLNIGQQATLDLSAVVRPGSIQASLLTGMLGVQDHPALIEMVGWLVYVIPVGLYVAWPPGQAFARATLARVALVTGGILAAAAVLLAVLAPTPPATDPVTTGMPAQVRSRTGDQATIRASIGAGPAKDFAARQTSAETHAGLATDVYQATTSASGTPTPGTMSMAELAQHNGGGCWECARTQSRRRYRSRCTDEPHHLLDRAGNRTGSRHAVDADVYDDRPPADRSGRVGRYAYHGERLAGRSHNDRRAPGAKGPLGGRSAPSGRRSRRCVRRRRCARPGHGARPAAR
jgi:high-affinity iron transporter